MFIVILDFQFIMKFSLVFSVLLIIFVNYFGIFKHL